MPNIIRETIIVILAVAIAATVGLVFVLRHLLQLQKKQTHNILEKIESVDIDIQKERKAIGRLKLGIGELSKKDQY